MSEDVTTGTPSDAATSPPALIQVHASGMSEIRVAPATQVLVEDVPRAPVRMLKVTDTELRQFAVFRTRSANMQGFCLFFAGCLFSALCSLFTLPPPGDKVEYGRVALHVFVVLLPILGALTGWLWRSEAKASRVEFDALMKTVDAKK